MKVSFSLANKAKSATTTAGAAPPLKQPAAFGSLDDEPIDAAPTATNTGFTRGNKAYIAQNAPSSSRAKKKIEAEMEVDASVYEYDAVWDQMQEAKLKKKLEKESESKERKPKYIAGALRTAAIRKLDYLRAEEKMIQREREMEGDEFAEKEQFVTQAYKDQMAEVRRAEEEEKKREELERNKKNLSTGMTHFYRQLLDQAEEEHSATVAATLAAPKIIGPTPLNLTIVKPPDHGPVSDIELARAARAEGKDVELNDDNQIVDKRQLLSAGLNLSAPNTRNLGGLRTSSSNKNPDEPVQVHRAVGTAASRKEIYERRMREIEQQLEEEKERAMEAQRREEQERMDRIIMKRNNEESVKSARERYLDRKRRRIEEERSTNADESENFHTSGEDGGTG